MILRLRHWPVLPACQSFIMRNSEIALWEVACGIVLWELDYATPYTGLSATSILAILSLRRIQSKHWYRCLHHIWAWKLALEKHRRKWQGQGRPGLQITGMRVFFIVFQWVELNVQFVWRELCKPSLAQMKQSSRHFFVLFASSSYELRTALKSIAGISMLYRHTLE